MPAISVVIITYNEEKNIERCIRSVEGVADEIVVVDSFSTDKTQEICEKYQVRFLKNKFVGHIEQKNFAITQATHPHILSLDADEALSEDLRQSILKAKENWQHDGYYFNRLTNYCGKWIKHCGWYPDRKLRLWDSRRGSWQGINPHDKFILQPGSKAHYLRGDLLHYSFYSIEQHMDQINKFSTIRAKEMHRMGKKACYLTMWVSPILKFVKSYFLKMGFLDGFYGYVICRNSAHANFLKYAKLRAIEKNQEQAPAP